MTLSTSEFLNEVFRNSQPGYLRIALGVGAEFEGNRFFMWPTEEEQLLKFVAAHPRNDIYFSPHLFRIPEAKQDWIRSRKEDALSEVSCIAADLDAADIGKLPLKPSVLVRTSKGRHQGFWLFHNPVPKTPAEEASRKLTYASGADPSGWTIGHLLRLPGTRNFKRSEIGEPVTIVEEPLHRHTLDSFDVLPDAPTDSVSEDFGVVDLVKVQSLPGPLQLIEKYGRNAGNLSLLKKRFEFVDPPAADGKSRRSEALWWLECECFRIGMAPEEVFVVARASANNKYADVRYNGDRDLWTDVQKARRETVPVESDLGAVLQQLRNEKRLSARERKKLIAKAVLDDMLERGAFYLTPANRLQYFREGRVVPVAERDRPLRDFITFVYGVNASEDEWKFLYEEIEGLKLDERTQRASLHPLTYYDKANKSLYVYDWDRSVYIVTPTQVTKHAHGENGVIFLKPAMRWDPIDLPDQEELDGIAWGLDQLLAGVAYSVDAKLNTRLARLLTASWLVSLLLRVEPAPLLLVTGEPASGKTFMLRRFAWWLYGNYGQVQSVQKEPRDLILSTSRHPMVAIDNVEAAPRWFPDLLAQVSTRVTPEERKLYTDDEMVQHEIVAYLAVNAINPPYNRSDVASRAITIELDRLEEGAVFDELRMKTEFMQMRGRIWRSMLMLVSRVLADLPNQEVAFGGRLTGYATVTQTVGRLLGYTDDEIKLAFTQLRAGQSRSAIGFADTAVLWDVLQDWLQGQGIVGRAVTARALYEELGIMGLMGEQFRKAIGSPRQLAQVLRRDRTILNEMGVGLEIQSQGDVAIYRFAGEVAAHVNGVNPDGP